MDTIFSILIGLGLSAACGFRVFVPLLVMSVAAISGHLTLAPGFAWIGTAPALLAFAIATSLEVAGYYVPWMDNLLDTLATPAAVVAGTVATAAMISDMDPLLRWVVAIIAGGGAAGLVQGATVVTRGASTVLTGGLMNPALSTVELAGSILSSAMALVVPVLGVLLVGVVIYFVIRRVQRVGSHPSAGLPSA